MHASNSSNVTIIVEAVSWCAAFAALINVKKKKHLCEKCIVYSSHGALHVYVPYHSRQFSSMKLWEARVRASGVAPCIRNTSRNITLGWSLDSCDWLTDCVDTCVYVIRVPPIIITYPKDKAPSVLCLLWAHHPTPSPPRLPLDSLNT